MSDAQARLNQVTDMLTSDKTATSIPFDPNCTKFPARNDGPKRPDAPADAAWVWGEDDQVSHLATGTFYNNTHTADIIGPDANLKCSIHHWSEHGGIAGRGVLLDYRAYADKKGIEYDSFIDHRIPYEELYSCGKDQGIDIRPQAQGGDIRIGDILFIRSGFIGQYHRVKSTEEWSKVALRPHAIGPDDQQKWAGVAQEEKMIDWLHDCYFTAVGGDSPSFEAWPSNRGKTSRER
ncbi:MAG: hypothetical protein L6R37_002971 [Teloschistes peruensis]|nr:MAG: hypothetical protein L6R37_002971 [Teloschistes peruensis]